MRDQEDSNQPTDNEDSNPSPDSPQVAPPVTPTQHEVPREPNQRADNQNATARELAREFRWVEVTQLIINGALAIIGIVALWIYYGQLRVMRGQLGEIIKQYPELQKSADAAKSAAETANATLKSSEKSFIIDQRPYVIVEGNGLHFVTYPPVADQPIEITTFLKNVGKTPAIQIVMNIHLLTFKGKAIAGLAKKEIRQEQQRYISLLEPAFLKLRSDDEKIRSEIIKLKNLSVGQDLAPLSDTFMTSHNPVSISRAICLC
jgi:hypothetical protein